MVPSRESRVHPQSINCACVHVNASVVTSSFYIPVCTNDSFCHCYCLYAFYCSIPSPQYQCQRILPLCMTRLGWRKRPLFRISRGFCDRGLLPLIVLFLKYIQAFRRLARVYHPDRVQNQQSQQSGSALVSEISLSLSLSQSLSH